MKFLADGMLGKFARWLRMLGQYVTYSTQLHDNELLELTKAEGRVLLTKDFELYKSAIRRGLDAFYVEGEVESEMLAEVAKRYGVRLEVDIDKENCPICNTPLKAAVKEQFRDKLEAKTYLHYDRFWHCLTCGQVYWQGAH